MRRLRQGTLLAVALVGVLAAVLGVGWHRHALGGHWSAAIWPAAQPPGQRSDPAPRPDRPNIVFVLTDDLSMNLLPFMPQVQQLQRRGMTFDRFFVTTSLCCPSRSTILTGGYAHSTGVITNGGSNGGVGEFRHRKADHQTFATSLQAAGYTTAMMGKYLNGYRVNPPNMTPLATIPPGWDEWFAPGDHDGYGGYNYTLNENGRLVHYGQAPDDYITDVLSAKGVDFINRASATGKPFLLKVSTFGPHAPYTPAPRHLDDYPGLTYPRTSAFDRAMTPNDLPWIAAHKRLSPQEKAAIDTKFRKRVQSVQSVDDLLANLVNALRATGELDNTYVVFSSDNGYHMGEHRLKIGKMTAFDVDARVPLVIAGPGVKAGATNQALVANIDLCPTFQEIGGGAPTALVDGRSLLPLLRGESPASGWRKAILIEHRRPVTFVQVGPDRQPSISMPPTYHALRFRDALYVQYADGQVEYYDVARDRHQVRNLAPQFTKQQRTTLSRTLATMAKCRGAHACWAASMKADGDPLGRGYLFPGPPTPTVRMISASP